MSFSADPIRAQFRSTLVDIARYLVTHPDAKDSLEGVVHWWRSDSTKEPDARQVRKVLHFMTSIGWLAARKTPGPQVIFSAAPGSLLQMQVFLTLHGQDERLAWRWLFQDGAGTRHE